jgi:hypothetical protein
VESKKLKMSCKKSHTHSTAGRKGDNLVGQIKSSSYQDAVYARLAIHQDRSLAALGGQRVAATR